MTYATTNPPFLIAQGIGGTQNRRLWMYISEDPSTDVDAADYFTDGFDLGMRAGDIVMVVDTNASPIDFSMHAVNSAAAADGVDLEDGTAIAGSDSD